MRPECQQCQEWMEEAFGDELKPELKPALDSHLAGCEECRAAWEDFRLLRRGLDVLAADEDGPSPFVEAKILRAAAARHAAKEAPSGFWRWLLRPATVGFATLALIAGLGYLGREELLQHRQASDLTAPVPAKPLAAPAAPSADSFGAGKAQESAPVIPPPAKINAPHERARRQDEEAAPQLQRLEKPKQAAPKPAPAAIPPPAPVEEKESAATSTAPATPGSASGPSGGAAKGEGRGRESSIPEAELAAPAPVAVPAQSEKDAKKESEALKASQPAANKNFQRPQSAQPSGGLDKTDDGAAAADLAPRDQREEGNFTRLVQGAKAKIQRQEYAGALDDLLSAQKIHDTKEIQDLILLCRSHLRGDG